MKVTDENKFKFLGTKGKPMVYLTKENDASLEYLKRWFTVQVGRA